MAVRSVPASLPRHVLAASLALTLAGCGEPGDGGGSTSGLTGALTSASATTSGAASTDATTSGSASATATATATTTADPSASDPSTGDSASTSGDPSGTSGTEGTGGSTGDPPVDDLCEPAGSLIGPGSLDGGMEGDAPVGWEVRTPGQVEACAGTGPHVFASPPAPGCAGGGITVDANDAWDCYAVQTVSPYNSIEGGATYLIRASARSEGNAVNPAAWFVLGVQWLDENDGFFGDEKNPKPADPADNDYPWQVLEWELVAPANARRILVWMSAHYPGQVEFDHVAVIKKG